MKLSTYVPQIGRYALPLERNAVEKRQPQCASHSQRNEFRAFAAKSGAAQQPLPSKHLPAPKPQSAPMIGPQPAPQQYSAPKVEKTSECVWWPSHTAFDRQLVPVGEPFERKGEIILVERSAGRYLTSRSLGRV